VPREQNTWADRLCHIAEHRKGDGIVMLNGKKIDNELFQTEDDLVGYKGHADTGGSSVCKKCGDYTEELCCWGCGKHYHYTCLSAKDYP
jgi:hypothetical protein